MNDLQRRVDTAFKCLAADSKPIFAQPNWKCCQACGMEALPDEHENNFVFYHEQEPERMTEKSQAFLYWAGDGERICNALRKAGVAVQWNGDIHEAIRVGPRN